MKKLTLLLLLAISLLTGGCAGMYDKMEPPSLSIANIDLIDATLLEQKYRIQLRVQNPNNFDLPIDGLAYELEINDKPFAKGLSNRAITVPRYGSEILEVEGVSTLAALFRQLAGMENNRERNLHYRFKGKINLRNTPFPVPFDHQGVVDLPPMGKAP